MLLHWHPRHVSGAALALRRSWGLGGMALVLFGQLVFGGARTVPVNEPTQFDLWDGGGWYDCTCHRAPWCIRCF